MAIVKVTNPVNAIMKIMWYMEWEKSIHKPTFKDALQHCKNTFIEFDTLQPLIDQLIQLCQPNKLTLAWVGNKSVIFYPESPFLKAKTQEGYWLQVDNNRVLIRTKLRFKCVR